MEWNSGDGRSRSAKLLKSKRRQIYYTNNICLDIIVKEQYGILPKRRELCFLFDFNEPTTKFYNLYKHQIQFVCINKCILRLYLTLVADIVFIFIDTLYSFNLLNHYRSYYTVLLSHQTNRNLCLSYAAWQDRLSPEIISTHFL